MVRPSTLKMSRAAVFIACLCTIMLSTGSDAKCCEVMSWERSYCYNDVAVKATVLNEHFEPAQEEWDYTAYAYDLDVLDVYKALNNEDFTGLQARTFIDLCGIRLTTNTTYIFHSFYIPGDLYDDLANYILVYACDVILEVGTNSTAENNLMEFYKNPPDCY